MSLKQKTIAKEFSLSGVGLHTGNSVEVTFKSAAENSGICFVRTDIDGNPSIQVGSENVFVDTNIQRCTTLGIDHVKIHTVEHLMSVLCGLEI